MSWFSKLTRGAKKFANGAYKDVIKPVGKEVGKVAKGVANTATGALNNVTNLGKNLTNPILWVLGGIAVVILLPKILDSEAAKEAVRSSKESATAAAL